MSNLSVRYLERLLESCEVVPAVNQIELHPGCQQNDVTSFCAQKNIAITGYCPLGSQDFPLLENEVVQKIAKARDINPACVLLSFQTNTPNTAVLTKSVKSERVEANFKVVELTDAEMKELSDIDAKQHFRVVGPAWTGWGAIGFPDCEENN